MRIVGGKYRGKKLWTPEGINVRPTSERAREAIFNILYSKIGGNYENIILLDVFAGTGAFAFEAISRGFKQVTLIDADIVPATKNAKLFAAEQDKICIIKADATKLPRARMQFDMVFMDAPYAKGLSEKCLQQLAAQNWLKKDAICVVELRKDEIFPLAEKYVLLDERIYGPARILFLRYQ